MHARPWLDASRRIASSPVPWSAAALQGPVVPRPTAEGIEVITGQGEHSPEGSATPPKHTLGAHRWRRFNKFSFGSINYAQSDSPLATVYAFVVFVLTERIYSHFALQILVE